MKIYVMTDMEGVAGVIDSPNYCFPESRYYERGCELTTLEVNAAVEGALAAGATDILVTDGHGHGAITPMLLHPEARLLKGRPRPYGAGLDESFDAAISIGQHAKSNAIGGHLAHSGSFAVEDLTINGVSVGETGSSFHQGDVFRRALCLLERRSGGDGRGRSVGAGDRNGGGERRH